VKIFPIVLGGAEYELKASCKGSWDVTYGPSGSYVYLYAVENGTSRFCYGIVNGWSGSFLDIEKQKIECAYGDSDHKVKMEFKQK
jgi:hypothetical protein